MAIEQNVPSSAGFFRGEDKRIEFTVFEADNVTPQNLTGWALSWIMDGPDIHRLVKTTTGAGIEIIDAPNGVCEVQIASDETDGWPPGIYRHELKRVDSDEELVLSFGTVYLLRSLHE